MEDDQDAVRQPRFFVGMNATSETHILQARRSFLSALEKTVDEIPIQSASPISANSPSLHPLLETWLLNATTTAEQQTSLSPPPPPPYIPPVFPFVSPHLISPLYQSTIAPMIPGSTLGYSMTQQLHPAPLLSTIAPIMPPQLTRGSEPIQIASQPVTPIKRAPRKKRAKILRDGQLTMIIYGANEALTWARRIGFFQNMMRDVLGNRRKTFTWSGSVTDSVVGAFLTQNVSDSLSSRAYMEVMSRWPAKGHKYAFLDDGHAMSDTVDWEAVRMAPIEDLIDAIKCRGLQMILSAKIKSFLHLTRHVNIRRLHARHVASNAHASMSLSLEGMHDDVLHVMDNLVGAVERSLLPDKETCVKHATSHGDDSVSMILPENIPHAATEVEDMDVEILLNALEESKKREPIVLHYEDDDSFRKDAPATAKQQQWHGQQYYDEYTNETTKDLLSLEWLRDVPDEEAREFLMNVDGLGRKSVACIMLLTLGKKEFPVDTNVGRICARLGWIPLESSQAIEDMDDYAPEPEVHAYLRSRLLVFDIETLYELHYQMITLGKIFCSKANPNCCACPMKNDCEYALNNGPSLHGRKKVKLEAEPLFRPEDGNTSGFYHDPSMPYHIPNNGAIPHQPPNGQRQMHWKTKQKLERMERERSEQSKIYSTLPLDALTDQRPVGLRTRDIRRPRSEYLVPGVQYYGGSMVDGEWVATFRDRGVASDLLLDDSVAVRGDASFRDEGLDAVLDDSFTDPSSLLCQLDALLGETPAPAAANGNTTVVMTDIAPPLPCFMLKSIPVAASPPRAATAAAQQQQDTIESPPSTPMAIPLTLSLPSSKQQHCIDDNGALFNTCIRLQALGKEMSTLSEAIGTLLNKNAPQCRIYNNRMLELSLQALNIDTTLTVDSANSVVSIAKRQYHSLARTLHPDKCKIEHAGDAFAAIGRAMSVISEYASDITINDSSSEAKTASSGKKETGNVGDILVTRSATDAMDVDNGALGLPLSGSSILHQIIWNTSRLVLPAHVITEDLYHHFPCQQLNYSLHCSEEAHLLFVPLKSIPTLEKTNHVFPLKEEKKTLVVVKEKGHDGLSMDPVQSLMNGMLDTLERGPCADGTVTQTAFATSSSDDNGDHEGDDVVQGVLLVTARAALHNRFPLNGTYFQINEVFADHATVLQPVSMNASILEKTKSSAVYFGLGIHYLSKAMTQQEVATMFSDGSVCFRAFDPVTRAPMLLPHFLLPNVPTQKSTWKNKYEREATKKEKEAKRMARLQSMLPSSKTGETVGGVGGLGVLQQQQQQQQQTGYVPGLSVPAATPLSMTAKQLPASTAQQYAYYSTTATASPSFINPSLMLNQPPRPKKQKVHASVEDARDAKSGKGKRRRFLFPQVPSTQRCGTCKACLNPKWKKACLKKREELISRGVLDGVDDKMDYKP